MPSFEFITDPLMGVYFVCAVFGGLMLILQFVMMMFGIGGDMDGVDGGGDFDTGDVGDSGGDFDDGADSTDSHPIGHSDGFDLFKVLSLRTVVAGITFFGLGGLIGLSGGFGHALSIVFALGAGIVALYTVYYIYLSFTRMKSDGNISEKTLIGANGNVYVKIPATGQGAGKVLVLQQDRTMEYEAISTGPEIKTGSPIVVVRVVSPTTVEVRVEN